MRPSRDENLMEHAHVVAKRGTCSRLQVGVIVARDGRILVTGYNGAPAGMDHCNHRCDCPTRELPHDAGCAFIEPCRASVHAEANAIAYAARWGISLEGSDMYCTDTPCVPCAQLMVNAGLVTVHFVRIYRDLRGLELLEEAGLGLHPHES